MYIIPRAKPITFSAEIIAAKDLVTRYTGYGSLIYLTCLYLLSDCAPHDDIV